MKEVLLGLEVTEMTELLGPSHPTFRARQLYHAVYRQRVTAIDDITTLPSSLRQELSERFELGWPTLKHRFESDDGTRRYLLILADGKIVESVFMPEQSRDTLCISTQIGCPVGCKFCLTATLGLERNLTAGEILGQVLYLCRDNQLDPRSRRLNIVLMGMGEPLLNLPAVLKATRILADPDGIGLSPRRITLSTIGLPSKLEELGREKTRPKLAISLNATTDQQRRQLIPVSRHYSLSELIEACRRYPLRSWEHLTFEYVMLAGVNDSEADARRLVRLLAGLRCKVNLIPYNPAPGLPFNTPAPERIAAFQTFVRKSIPCFVRKPRGQDIYAACGQLRLMTPHLLGAEPRAPEAC